MGSNGSKLVKKIVSPFSSSNPAGFSDCDPQTQGSSTKTISGPIVLSRQGSMFFDEDGDLAHEFYEEVRPNKRGSKAQMKRIQTNLVPQGEVLYQCPRLHADYPIILHQASDIEPWDCNPSYDEPIPDTFTVCLSPWLYRPF